MRGGGVYAASQTTLLQMKRNEESLLIRLSDFSSAASFCFQRQHFGFLFTAAGGMWHVAALKCLLLLNHRVDYIFLLDHGAHTERIPLNPMLGAYAATQTTLLRTKRLNKTPSPIFVYLCVLCFQRQPYGFFIFIKIN